MSRKLTTEEFIERARKIHGDKYDYSKVEYKDANTKVCIICPIHGEFWQIPNDHLHNKGCVKCGHKRLWDKRGRITTEDFTRKAKEIHGDKYDYSKVNYTKSNEKICIICRKHGEFWQTANDHLSGKGCFYCYGKRKFSTEQFIEKAHKVHGDKYDYSKVEYINNKTKVCIICPNHGEFWQVASSHLMGKGCKYCYGNVKKTTEQYIKEAAIVHNGAYNYSKVDYKGNHVKITITCPIHGNFEQDPIAHLKGQGCPYCYAEHKNLTETRLKQFFLNKDIKFIYQKHFEWLGRQSLDFYFPKYNSAIEYQGRQHFSTDSFYYKNNLDESLERDLRKIKLCNENGVKLYHLTNEIKYIPEDWQHYKLYTSLDEILQEMRNI